VSPEYAMSQSIAGGVKFFQYRSKNAGRRQIYETSLLLARQARERGVLFMVNDHADIAAAVDADGVHLGQDDLPIELARKLLGAGKRIGISTHSLEQAGNAETAGADYIGFGPLFPTTTKDAGEVQGLHKLTIVKQSVTVPVIAIGGINPGNVREVLRTGTDGVAVISAVLSSGDIRTAARNMIQLISDVRRNT
jgi:thiamine-phosphate pyrophosphorylase